MSDDLQGAHVPKIGFRWDLSFGNIIQIVVLIAGLVAGYYATIGKIESTAAAVVELKQIVIKIPELERRLDLTERDMVNGRAQRLDFQDRMVDALRGLEEDRKKQAEVNSQILQQLAGIIARLDERGIGDAR